MDTMSHRPSSKDSKVREQRLVVEQGVRVENASAGSWERDGQSDQCQEDEFLQNHIGEIKSYLTHHTTADDYYDGDSTTTDNGPKSFAEKSNASHSMRHSLALSSSKHEIEGVKSDDIVFSELQRMKEKLSEQEEEMEGKVSVLEQELRKQEKELRDMGKRDEKFKAKETDYVSQLAADLEAYKDECAAYRDRILHKEREVAKMESLLYEERKKVLSLESENKILLNVADDNVCNSMDYDRARTLELTAYREQCDKYRQHVLELTRNALTAEEALEATGHVALAYEEEKKSLLAQLEQVNSINISHEATCECLRSKLENEESKTKTLEAELSTLKLRCDAAQTDVVDAKRKADEDRKLMSILESENAALLQKLNDSNTSLEKLQTIANQCHQTEEENNLLRKRNDELLAKQIEMSNEVHDARGISSNFTRLQKIMSENECYISKLQDDLSKARAVHLESLQTTRQKYSDEIDALTKKLTCEKQSRRMAEIKNNELEDKFLSIERKLSDLQSVGTHQTKAQDDQVMRLMQHADDLRKKNAECRDEYASLEREMSDKNHANECIIKELQSKLTLIEGVNSKMSEDLANVNMEVLLVRESKMKEVDELIQIIREKDCALLTLRSEISEVDAVKASDTERLKGIIQRIEQDLEVAKSSNSSLKKRLYKIKQHSFDVMNSMRIEKMTLLSDVQSLILNERVALMKQAKEIAYAYGRKVESRLLACSMTHSVAMSAINLEKSDIECLLQTESEKRHNLEKSLERTRNENQALVDILDSACVKLSAKNKDSLVDSIDEFLLDRSETTLQIRTLEVDMKSLASHNAHLEYEKDKLFNQLEDKQVKVRELESELDGVRDGLRNQKEEYTSLEEKLQELIKESECVQDQMKKAFDDERSSQDKIVAKIISEKEEAVLCQRDLRTKLNSQSEEIAVRDSQLLEVQAKLDESRQERDDLCAKYEDSREQIASLLDKALNSKDHANNLMAHYMEIEDDLRRQLQSVQDEKVGLERRLTIVQRESDRSLGNLCREKHSLTSTLESKEDSLLALQEHIEDLRKSKKESQEKIDELIKEVNYLKQSNREMYEQYEVVCSERDQLYNKAEKLISFMENSVSTRDVTVDELNSEMANMVETSQKHVDTMETLQDKIHHITADREHLSCTVGILESYHEANDATIKNLKTALEEERLSQKKKLDSLHGEIARMATEKDTSAQQIKDLTSKVAELEAYNESEIQMMKLSIEAEKLVHSNAMAEAQSVFDSELEHHQTKAQTLMKEVKKLHETIAEKDDQILQLKASLKDSLEEALRLGSKITSEQAKLLEVTHTMSNFEEENFKLKQSLEQSQSEVDGIATVLSSQELEQYDLKLSLENKEKIAIETMNKLNHFQLKLARAEQERDTLSKGADAKITRLKNELSLLEKTKQEKEKSLLRQLARSEQERDAQSEAAHAEITRLKNDLSSLEKMQQEKEKYLMSQIVALKEDRELGDSNDHLYRELLSKLDDKETYYNSRIRSMMNDIDSLNEEIKSLTEENNRLFHVNEGIIADYESLAVEKNMLSLANDHILFENSRLLENAKLSAKEGDELSTKSGASRADHLNRTASELEATILAIKKHHSNTVKRLQGELDDARSRLKKYQQKVKDLTVLIEENAFVIEALHRKLRGKKCNQNSAGAPLHLTRSRDNSLVSE
ncbi:hypothetical protein ACHAW5_008595 [Stephanodiscus triporus]|uniref:Uncharacterized protein n=1 Tax=Stephanodiscus triporus TaxID=2934178 RepID=A0ABD3NSH2_9STRA